MLFSSNADWALMDFAQDCLPDADAAVVLMGTPGPAQKVVVQLWSGARVVGYLKYGERPGALARLEHEHRVLRSLPSGLGPRILKYGHYADGVALITTPLKGKQLPINMRLKPQIATFLKGLEQSESYSVDEHPWIRGMNARHRSVIDPWLGPLSHRLWPTVVQHGDFVPWNLVQTDTDSIAALDWEYGTLQGFPLLDVAYFFLRLAQSVRRWHPQYSFRRSVVYLKRYDASLSTSQAQAIVRLTALDFFLKASSDGMADTSTAQAWRKAVWETEL